MIHLFIIEIGDILNSGRTGFKISNITKLTIIH